MYPTWIAFVLLIGVLGAALFLRKKSSRCAGLVQGVAVQIIIVMPITILQLSGFVWKSWSIDFKEAVSIFPLTVLFDMAGWTVVTPFEWLVPKRQTWVFSNLSEFGILWISKVMLVAICIAWQKERKGSLWNWFTYITIGLLFVDAWLTRDFPCWGT